MGDSAGPAGPAGGSLAVSEQPVFSKPQRRCYAPRSWSIGRRHGGRRPVWHSQTRYSQRQGTDTMGKGNNSQKNDKKNKKPKQDKTKTIVKK